MGNLCRRSTNTQILERNNSQSTSNSQRLQNEEECRHDPDAPEASNVNNDEVLDEETIDRHDPDAPEASNVNDDEETIDRHVDDDEVLDEETIESLEKLRKEMESPNFNGVLVIVRLHSLMKNLQEIKDSNFPVTEQQSSFDNMVKKPINYVLEKWAVIKKTGVPQKMAKLTASVLEKVGQTGFILVGLSFIGSMLNQATEVPATTKSCIKFLKSVRCLHSILNSDICSYGLHVIPGSPLDLVIDEITNGIIVCCSYARAGFPPQFLQVECVKVDLVGISDSLYKAIQTLNLEVQFLNLEVGFDTLYEVKSLKRQRTKVITHNENIKDTDKDVVGIDERVAEVKMLLQMEDHDAKGVAVILHGPGGVGKTTLASNVINALKPSSAHFSYASVTLDSNRQDFETQVKDLQSELISQLKGSKFEVGCILAGQQVLKTLFSYHSCFIFVDNVVDGRQLDYLFPNEIPIHHTHGNHTHRILVTSRDVDVRKNIPLDINHIKLYPIDMLGDEPSLVLLKKTMDMWGEIEQFRGETRKLEQVAKLCYGIPLLLIQVGRDLKFWRQEYYYDKTLKRLEKADFSTYRSKTLDDSLLCTFRRLEIDVQTAFLDICVFFVEDLKWESVSYIVGAKAMHILTERSMIRKGDYEYSQVIVHDVLKTMALRFAKVQRSHFIITIDPVKIGSRSVKLSDLLEEHVDATEIQGLAIHNLRQFPHIRVQLGNLPSLRIFSSSFGISVEFKEEKGQPSSFDNLCYFHIYQKRQRDVIELLLKERKSILPLQVLSLYYCDDVEEFPKNLGMIQHLRVLELCFWDRLKCVPSAIQYLQFLEVLDLSGCYNIESLPEELGQLHSLKILGLGSCRNLKGLPSTISNLSCLIDLQMSWCESIASLPDDMWKLASLERLDLGNCTQLVGLPSHLEGLVSLKHLDLTGYTEIEWLPEQLGKLHALEELHLQGCDGLQCLPQSISELQALKVLNMTDCESITCLPEDICKLGSLEELDLQGCRNLRLTPSQLEWMAGLKDFKM